MKKLKLEPGNVPNRINIYFKDSNIIKRLRKVANDYNKTITAVIRDMIERCLKDMGY